MLPLPKLIKKNDRYYCSNCMLRQNVLREQCYFCGGLFSNYEEIVIQEMIDKNYQELTSE